MIIDMISPVLRYISCNNDIPTIMLQFWPSKK